MLLGGGGLEVSGGGGAGLALGSWAWLERLVTRQNVETEMRVRAIGSRRTRALLT